MLQSHALTDAKRGQGAILHGLRESLVWQTAVTSDEVHLYVAVVVLQRQGSLPHDWVSLQRDKTEDIRHGDGWDETDDVRHGDGWNEIDDDVRHGDGWDKTGNVRYSMSRGDRLKLSKYTNCQLGT